jgi:hypothetical protein
MVGEHTLPDPMGLGRRIAVLKLDCHGRNHDLGVCKLGWRLGTSAAEALRLGSLRNHMYIRVGWNDQVGCSSMLTTHVLATSHGKLLLHASME